jgi:hypothetical protein
MVKKEVDPCPIGDASKVLDTVGSTKGSLAVITSPVPGPKLFWGVLLGKKKKKKKKKIGRKNKLLGIVVKT